MASKVNAAFFLPRILGLFPFKTENGTVSLNKWMGSWTVFVRILLPLVTMSVWNLMAEQARNSGLKERVVGFIINITRLVVPTCCTLAVLLQRANIFRVLKMFEEADKEFVRLGEIPRSRFTSPFDYGMVFLSFLPEVFFRTRAGGVGLFFGLQDSFARCSFFIAILPFVRILDNLRVRILRTRCLLRRLRREDIETLASVIELHEMLCSTCVYLNDAFSFQLLFVVSSSFIHLLFGVYYIQDLFFGGNDYGKCFHFVTIVIFFLIMNAILSSVCDKTSEEANSFCDVLFFMVLKDKIVDINKNKKVDVQISARKNLSFSASGFFTIDYKLLLSMATAMISYLIFIIQF